MSGVVFPNAGRHKASGPSGLVSLVTSTIWRNRFFFGFVVLPTLLAGLYYGLFAAKQYETSAEFVVRRAESPTGGSGIGQVLGFNIGTSASASEAYVVQTYLLSHDAVARLRQSNNLIEVFRRPEADWITKLHFEDPERLLTYYRKKVTITQDDTSGVNRLVVHTFRPADSYAIAAKLLQMGEEQINQINQRTYNDQVSNSERELAVAEHQLNEVQAQFTAYRRMHKDINPANTGQANVTMVTELTASLVASRARLQAMNGTISPASPQYKAMAGQVAALEGQVAAQSTKIAGPSNSVATRLSDYEQLQIQREEIAKVYGAAAAQLEQSKAEAKRKQLYLIRVVEPNMPVRSEFPKRTEAVLTIFVTLFFAYAIGWLLWSGFKEHSLS